MFCLFLKALLICKLTFTTANTIVMYFHNLLFTLFSPLSREVANIHRGYYQSLTHKILYILLCLYMLIRLIVTSVSLHFDIPGYFTYDVINRLIFYNTVLRKKYLALFFSFIPLFTLRLFYLIYLCPRSFVWEHLYDILGESKFLFVHLYSANLNVMLYVVRNRNQAYLQLNGCEKWAQWKIPKSSKLLHYPFLSRQLRVKIICITIVCEALTSLALFITVLFIFLTIYILTSDQSLTSAEVLLVIIDMSTFEVYIFITIHMALLVMFTLYLVCYIYVTQYWKLNRKLVTITDSFGRSASLSGSKISRVTAAYRASHTRLTNFILRYNSSLISKVIASYMANIMPFHAYGFVLVYFQHQDMPTFITVDISLVLFLFSSLPFIVNLAVTMVNKVISSSGRQLGVIFAYNSGNKRQQQSLDSRAAWNRESFKLSTYYQLVWRDENELAFTAGPTTTMNWKFLVKVNP